MCLMIFKKLLAIMFIYFLCNPAFTQSIEREVDSLIQLIKVVKNDSIKTDYYNELAEIYRAYQPNQALKYGRKALALGKKIEYGIGTAYENLFLAHGNAGTHSDSLLTYAQLLKQHYDQSEDDRDKMIVLWSYAMYYETIKQNDKVIETYLTALNIIQASDDISLKRNEGPLLNNIASSFSYMGRDDEALRYYEKALKIVVDKDSKANILFNIGNIYEGFNKLDTAQVIYDKAYLLYKERNDLEGVSDVIMKRAKYQDVKKQFESANQLYFQALEIIQKNEIGISFVDIYYSLSKHYLNRKIYPLSLEYGEKALQESIEQGSLEFISDIYAILDESYTAVGNYKKAHEVRGWIIEYKDSTNSETLIDKISELQTTFEVEQKEIENQLLIAETTANKATILKQMLIVIAGFIVLVLISFTAILLRRSNTLKVEQNEVLETEVKKRTKELIHANQALEEAKSRRILEAAKSRFFANVSHELRTPLTLIQAPLQIVLNSGNLDNKNWTRISKALQNSQKLEGLVTQILDLTKFDANKLKLNETTEVFYLIIRKVIASFESYTQQKEIKLILKYEAFNDLQIEIDKEKLERIVTNYLSNAIKFTPKGGNVMLVVKDLGNQLQVAVIDTGIGIHISEIERVFERYYQASHNTNNPLGQVNHYSAGTGIGLALCSDYAQLFNGKVWAKSPVEAEKGSAFYFEFPKKEVFGSLNTETKLRLNQTISPIRTAKEKVIDINILQHKNKVLIVEDNFDLRLFLAELLEEEYEIITAENGQEALDILEKIRIANSLTLPSLIISDVMMPIMDGFELLKSLKSSDDFRHIPVMMLTARVELRDKLTALRIGVDDYVLKPFHEVELKIITRNLVNKFQERVAHIGKSKQKEVVIDKEKTPLELKMSKNDIAFLQSLETFVINNIGRYKLTAETIAEALLTSRAKLFRRVKALTTLTLNEYVNEVRLQKAKSLLEDKAVSSVKEITHAVGFKQSSYFSKIYAARFGKRPSDYM